MIGFEKGARLGNKKGASVDNRVQLKKGARLGKKGARLVKKGARLGTSRSTWSKFK